jgi:hypothetical protein
MQCHAMSADKTMLVAYTCIGHSFASVPLLLSLTSMHATHMCLLPLMASPTSKQASKQPTCISLHVRAALNATKELLHPLVQRGHQARERLRLGREQHTGCMFNRKRTHGTAPTCDQLRCSWCQATQLTQTSNTRPTANQIVGA